MKKKIIRIMAWFLAIVGVLVLGVGVYMNTPQFGSLPKGDRLERVKKSPNYKDGSFQNRIPVKQAIDEQPFILSLYEFLTDRTKHLIPETPLPVIQTDLKSLSIDQQLLIWFGHSSLYLQTDGKRILVDPVFLTASPVVGTNKPFKMSYKYTPEDLPPIDFLIITHDHWDHLDYQTIVRMREKVKHVICPLGVGAHFERWGFEDTQITELDWYDTTDIAQPIQITAWPARHFSGRGFQRNKSLWAGYVLESTQSGNIFISGDTGYDIHFQQLKSQFGDVNLAIIENGQYNEKWREIHIMPDGLTQAIDELQPGKILSVHNSKYALARHAWYHPLEAIYESARKNDFNLLTPKMGEILFLNDDTQTFSTWWKEYMPIVENQSIQ